MRSAASNAPQVASGALSTGHGGASLIFACTLLAAGGVTLTLAAAISELSFHLPDPTKAPALAMAALGAGGILGLWLPRRTIRRRLAMQASPPSPAEEPTRTTISTHAAHRDDSDADDNPAKDAPQLSMLIASLAGAAFVVLAVAALGLGAVAQTTELLRAELTRRFVFPAVIVPTLLAMPLLLLFAVVGAAAATVLITLHGWCRLLDQTDRGFTLLWYALLAAVVAGGLSTDQLSPSAAALVGPGLIFAAGTIAVIRRSHTTTELRPPIPERSERTPAFPLFAAGAAAALLAVAALAALPAVIGLHGLGGRMALAGSAGVCTLLVLRFLPQSGVTALQLALFGTFVAVVLPYTSFAASEVVAKTARLAATAGLAAACITLAAGQIRIAGRSVQLALARIGTVVLIGAAVAAVTWSIAAATPRSEGAAPGGIRRSVAQAHLALADGSRPVAIVEADGPWPETAGGVDLAGPRFETLWLARSRTPADQAQSIASDTGDRKAAAYTADRLVGRCDRALLGGGRLVIESPSERVADAAIRLWRNDADGRELTLVRTSAAGSIYDALVLAPHAAAWVGSAPLPDGCTRTLYPISGHRQYRMLLERLDAGPTSRP